jgi:hypothetical protein
MGSCRYYFAASGKTCEYYCGTEDTVLDFKKFVAYNQNLPVEKLVLTIGDTDILDDRVKLWDLVGHTKETVSVSLKSLKGGCCSILSCLCFPFKKICTKGCCMG